MTTSPPDRLSIALPYPPSANRMWRHVGNRTLRSREYEAWRQEASAIIAEVADGRMINGPYALQMHAGRPDRRRRDLDNLIKPVGDALVLGGAVRDDCDCQQIEAAWLPGLVGISVVLTPRERA